MATFISKEEILAGAREVPAALGAAPSPSSGLFGPGPVGGTNPIDQLERVLTQINSILTQVNTIRNNPTTKSLMGQVENKPEAVRMIESARAAPVQPAPQPQAPQQEPKFAVNEEGVKEFLADVMAELDKMPDEIKNMSISAGLLAYKLMPDKKAQFEANAIGKFNAFLPKLIKRV